MKKIYKKTGFQLLAWFALFFFFFNISNYFQPGKTAVILSAFDTMMLFLIYQGTLHFLFPRFYSLARMYWLISIVVILIYSLVYFILDIYIMSEFKQPNDNHPPLFFHYLRMFIASGFMFFVGTSVALMEHNNQLQEREKLLTEEKLETELKLLKAQINPHFIFNALNNIYSLTYMKAKKAPESVLKLSEMLRYVFYDCSKDRVQIASEVNYIENFNAFQQMKSDFIQNITLQSDIETNIEIAPMLFIPFIENAFKYSRIEEIEMAHVNISITSKNRNVDFTIENSMPIENKPAAGSGTGIKNVQHRLNILYPGKHNLIIDEKRGQYLVNLRIEV
jgi:two-component system, LytTR family, sensor kinase